MSVKVRLNHLCLIMYILSTLFEGVLWEGIGWLALVYIFVSVRSYALTYSRRSRALCLALICIIVYVILQIYALSLNSTQVVRLYGITKTVAALPIVALCLTDYTKTYNPIKDILPALLIIDVIMFVYLITGIESLNIVHGTRNYIGAINVILLPYIWIYYPDTRKWEKGLFILFVFLLSLFSGSRTTLATSMIAVAGLVSLDKSSSKKIKYIALFSVVILILFIVASSVGLTENLSRGISVLTNLHDQSRIDLSTSAIGQYNGYTDLQKKIGNGNNLVLWREAPPHNCFQEVLLCYGLYGLVGFIAGIIVCVLICFNKKYSNKRCLLLELGLAILIGLVQPFITTGYLFQICFSISFIALVIENYKCGLQYD